MFPDLAKTVGAVSVGALLGFGVASVREPEVQQDPFAGGAVVEELSEEQLEIMSGEHPLIVFGQGPSGQRQLEDVVPRGEKRVFTRDGELSIFAIEIFKQCPRPDQPCIDCRYGQCGTLRPPMSLAMFEPRPRSGEWCNCAAYRRGECAPSDEECAADTGG